MRAITDPHTGLRDWVPEIPRESRVNVVQRFLDWWHANVVI
jgi:hypothetical protein